MKTMTRDDTLEVARSYQPACVLAAAADLDLFGVLAPRPLEAREAARALDSDVRGLTILLDALVALDFLRKEGSRYSVPEDLVPLLAGHGTGSVLAMAQHQANCLRRWSQLARAVKTGEPVEGCGSIRGEEADRESFIGAMDNVSAPVADDLVSELKSLDVRHLLDVGGASGTWTLAFLRAFPQSVATLTDLPAVIPLAEQRIREAGWSDRVTLVSGDYLTDPLPSGADLAWVSAIVHQNSRRQNRLLFGKLFRALTAGATIAVRDIIMEPGRTSPAAGALFAVNMLVATEGGGTFTFLELQEDLEAGGFTDIRVLRRDPGMNAIVVGRKLEATAGGS